MSFFRAEATAALMRWRETIAGVAALALGGYWVLWSGGALFLLGIALFVGGVALALAGVQRARFRRGSGGPGVVQVDEGRITYFGPFSGGTVAVQAIVRIELDRVGPGRALWGLVDDQEARLDIPVNAEAADALFDAFATLPGLQTEAMLSALGDRSRGRRVIWSRDLRRLH